MRTLRDRLPADLRDGTRGPDLQAAPFTSIYQTHDEWAAELANRTVHTVMLGSVAGSVVRQPVAASWAVHGQGQLRIDEELGKGAGLVASACGWVLRKSS